MAVAGSAQAAARIGPVERALAAAGGRDLLSCVRVVSWSGVARMMLGKTAVTLNVETRLEPFVRGRSDTWLVGEGRSSARTLMIERDSGFVVHEGAQTPMPDAMALFERQQLGAYAYLLLAQVTLVASGPGRLLATHDGYPPIKLGLASDGRVASADYVIASPDPVKPPMRQHFALSGTVTERGVRFPRLIAISADGRPLLRLALSDFMVELGA